MDSESESRERQSPDWCRDELWILSSGFARHVLRELVAHAAAEEVTAGGLTITVKFKLKRS